MKSQLIIFVSTLLATVTFAAHEQLSWDTDEYTGIAYSHLDNLEEKSTKKLIEFMGRPTLRQSRDLDRLLDELIGREDLPKYPIEIKQSLQRRLLHNDLKIVAYIAEYRGFCRLAFPKLSIDFSFDHTPINEEDHKSWVAICAACPAKKGRRFKALCKSVNKRH